jgi:bla regulator protein BlaR1
MHASLIRGALRFAASSTLVTSVALFGQVGPAPTSLTPEMKTHAFDVVSIKPSDSKGIRHFGLAPTGYSTAEMAIAVVIRQAYFPRNWSGKILGAPDWVSNERFDVEGKVTVADLDEWQKERTQPTQPLIEQLLQNMLAERCKHVAHRVPSEAEGYALIVDKRGAKLKEAAPDEARPDHGQPAGGGGYLVPYRGGDVPHISFYGVTMASFAEFLVGMGGGQVVDRTGLTGRYDFTLTWLSSGPEEQHEGGISSDDPDKLSHWNFGALGLRAEQVKVPTEDLVVDHIERPSMN